MSVPRPPDSSTPRPARFRPSSRTAPEPHVEAAATRPSPRRPRRLPAPARCRRALWPLLLPLHHNALPKVAAMLRSFPQARRLLKRLGFEKEDAYFFKQMGKAMLCTYTLFGVAWLWNETSPLGWWTLKPRPKEEKEMAHLYERREFPYPGDEEAVEEFIKSGGALGTTIGPKGFADANMDSDNMQKQLQSKKFEQEAQKLWLRMRNEVIQELQEKGFDIE